MKVEGFLFSFIAVFLGGAAVVYWFTSYDPAGTTALSLGCGLGILTGTYLLVTGRRTDERWEDMDDAEIADGAGEIGFFSPYSWAPLWCAGAAAIAFAGVAFGWWMVYLGAALAVPAIGSMLFEYYTDEV